MPFSILIFFAEQLNYTKAWDHQIVSSHLGWLCTTMLVLGWVTVCGLVDHFGM